MRAPTVALFLVLLIGCGSGGQQPFTASGGRAAVGVVLTAPVFFGSGTTAPANLDVIVENHSAQPIVVRAIRVEGMGMAQWTIYPIQRVFNETINPGMGKAFPIFATAATSRTRYTPNEPLSVRALVQFDSGTERFQELFTGMVQGQ